MKNPVILIVRGDTSFRSDLGDYLREKEYQLIEIHKNERVLDSVLEKRPDLIILDHSSTLPAEGAEIVWDIRRFDRHVPILLVTSTLTEELAVMAIRARVSDCLKEPLERAKLIQSVRRCLGESYFTRQQTYPTVVSSSLAGCERLIGDSLLMSAIRTYIGKVAPTDKDMLITGETGTGKDLVAEIIHNHSSRCRNRFVTLNCAAIPDELLETELFGCENSTFPHSELVNRGKLKLADGGTLFFDEIGDLSQGAQAKVLRAIESRHHSSTGRNGHNGLDIRVIAATNQNLDAKVAEGRFRKDLFFRLNVGRIHLPPLRERKEDIPALLQFYLRELNAGCDQGVVGVSKELLEKLIFYDWPGNVRELKNLLEGVLMNAPHLEVSIDDLPEEYRKRFGNDEKKPQVELERLVSALFSTNWNKSMAAEKLNWSRMTLYRKMAKYHLVKGGTESILRECNITSDDDTPVLHTRRDR